jgi:hypothetical protein
MEVIWITKLDRIKEQIAIGHLSEIATKKVTMKRKGTIDFSMVKIVWSVRYLLRYLT